jgi:hypothetical protein
MKKLLLILLFLSLLFSSYNQENYKDISSSKNDITYYNLGEKKVIDDNGSVIKFSIPKQWNRIDNNLLEDGVIVQYELFENTGYTFSISQLETRNTVKLNDKEYLQIMTDAIETKYSGDLDKIGRLLSPSIYKDIQVVQFDGNLIINGNYFGRRICFFKDARLKNTYLEDVNVTEFHFITLQNKRKYTITISYYGDDKGLPNLVGIMNTIGGSVKFN